MELVRKGLYGPALKLITEKNPLPFLTGTICAHRCQTKCSRNFYDESVRIRDTKLVAAERGYEALMASIQKPAKVAGKKAAIIGGGPPASPPPISWAVPVSRPPFSSGSSAWAASPAT